MTEARPGEHPPGAGSNVDRMPTLRMRISLEASSSLGQDVLQILVGASLVIMLASGVGGILSIDATAADRADLLQIAAGAALVAVILGAIGVRAAARQEAEAQAEMIDASRRVAAAAEVAEEAAGRYFEILDGRSSAAGPHV